MSDHEKQSGQPSHTPVTREQARDETGANLHKTDSPQQPSGPKVPDPSPKSDK